MTQQIKAAKDARQNPGAPDAPIEVCSSGTGGDWFVVKSAAADEKDTKFLRQDRWEEILIDLLNAQNVAVLAGSGTSLGPRAKGPSMKELFAAVKGHADFQKVVQLAKHNQKDENIENLLSCCKSSLPFIADAERAVVEGFVKHSEKLIAQMCNSFLSAADLSTHQIFLRRLGRRSTTRPRLKLFTTNYDLCFERAASQIQCPIIDGFSFSSPRSFSPRFFGYDFVRRGVDTTGSPDFVEGVFHLYKLHGSVDWQRANNEIVRADGTETPCLIYPAATKYEQSYSQPYLEMMSQFLASVRGANTTLLVVGFGFNDDHLAQPILAAVRSNAGMRLLVVDPSAKAKVGSADAPYHNELKAFIDEKDERVTLVNSTFDAFTRHVPDLARRTLEERLAEAVQRVTKARQ